MRQECCSAKGVFLRSHGPLSIATPPGLKGKTRPPLPSAGAHLGAAVHGGVAVHHQRPLSQVAIEMDGVELAQVEDRRVPDGGHAGTGIEPANCETGAASDAHPGWLALKRLFPDPPLPSPPPTPEIITQLQKSLAKATQREATGRRQPGRL